MLQPALAPGAAAPAPRSCNEARHSQRIVTLIQFVAAAGLVFGLAARATAYSLMGTRWTGSTVTMHLQLGADSGPLLDGFASWDASAEDALNRWNSHITALRFTVMRDSIAPRVQGNRINNVHFAGDLHGQSWGANVLAVTLTYSSGTSQTESDVVFNQGLSWNSYRGPQRHSPAGTPIYDFHRVALHEFGHVLGLGHPDEAGQNVTALMNSRISSLDTLSADDINGAQALYGSPPPALTAPVIATHPVSRSVTAGSSTSFSVVVGNNAGVSYQWLKGGFPIASAVFATLALNNVSTLDAGNYAVIVSNSAGAVTSATATLTVTAPPPPAVAAPPPVFPPAPPAPAPSPAPVILAPRIVTQPTSQTVSAGRSATFSVSASGTAPLSYQWRKDGVAVAGATSPVYSIARAQLSDTGTYAAFVRNPGGTAISSAASLTVGSAPAIVAPPASQTVTAGQRVVLAVTAAGTPGPAYQWFKDTAALAGATASTHTIDPAQPSHAGSYHVVATNSFGTAASAAAVIAVHVPPAIVRAPANRSIAEGRPVALTVAANGHPEPAYQWIKDGVELPGATGATLTFEAARPAEAGAYSVRVTNAAGSVTTPGAMLTVRFSRLVNLSTRAFVPAGGTLTPGFFLRGPDAKSLLIRAVGPTLAFFGVEDALAETALDVIAQGSSAIVASNTGWGGSLALGSAFARLGAFPLGADSKDAAVEASLLPSGYTVRVSPGGGIMSGVALAEIYDADALTAATQLVNVSTLAFVGPGTGVLTAGFTISGNAPKRLLIRAVGPGLEPFGVTDRLPDPRLSLVPLGATEPVALNDNWPGTANVHAVFSAAGAFELPVGSNDAALVITLEPGGYTVVVSGVGGATGHALVEIYALEP